MQITKSLAIILAVIAIAGAGTYAAYNSTASITGTTFSASTMNLMIDADPSGSVYNWMSGFANSTNPFAKVKPGDSGEQIIDIKNVGEVDGSATIKFDATAWSALGDNLIFTVLYDGNHDGTFESTVASGPLSAWNGNTYTLGAITSPSTNDGGNDGKIASVKIQWSVPFSAGNDIQGKSVTVDTVFGLNQLGS